MSAKNVAMSLHTDSLQLLDPGSGGSITVDRQLAYVSLVSAGAEARTLNRPTAVGQFAILYAKTTVGTISLTVTGGYNSDGDTAFSFTTAKQWLLLVSSVNASGVYEWRKVADYAIGNILPADAAVIDEFSGLTATVAELNARAAAASRLVNVTDAATYAVLAADSGKIHIMPNFTATCTLTLPTAAAGLEYEFVSKAIAADAQDWRFSTGGANFWLGGLAFADTDAGAGADEISNGVFPNGSSNDFITIVTPGAGTRIHVVCDGTNWIVSGIVFSATTPAFADT